MPRLVGLATRPVAIGDLLGFMEYPGIAGAVLLHLCWRQRTVFDLDAPLRETTLVVASIEAAMRVPVRLKPGMWVGFEEQRPPADRFPRRDGAAALGDRCRAADPGR